MDTKKPTDKPQLLKELSDIRSLLGEDDIPVIGLEPPPRNTESKAEIPTLSVSERARSTSNPFLQSGPIEPPVDLKPILQADVNATTGIPEGRTNPFLSSTATPASRPATISHTQQQALVDQLVLKWMPEIERELRSRLLDALNNKSS